MAPSLDPPHTKPTTPPTINNQQVEHKSIPQIAAELARLQHTAAAGKLTAQELAGGSLTISNIGEERSLKAQRLGGSNKQHGLIRLQHNNPHHPPPDATPSIA